MCWKTIWSADLKLLSPLPVFLNQLREHPISRVRGKAKQEYMYHQSSREAHIGTMRVPLQTRKREQVYSMFHHHRLSPSTKGHSSHHQKHTLKVEKLS